MFVLTTAGKVGDRSDVTGGAGHQNFGISF
jgi:hypothetical protein